MVDIEKIKACLLAADFTEVYVRSEGSHYEIIVVGDVFKDLRLVQQQQMVYAPIQQFIATGELHAITIKTFTMAEWRREKMLHIHAFK